MGKFKYKPSEILRQNHMEQIRDLFMDKDKGRVRACAIGKILYRRGVAFINFSHTVIGHPKLSDIPPAVINQIIYWNDNARLSFEQIADRLEKEYDL